MSDAPARVVFTSGFSARYTGGKREFEVQAKNLRGVIKAMDQLFPGLGETLEEETTVAIDGELLRDRLRDPGEAGRRGVLHSEDRRRLADRPGPAPLLRQSLYAAIVSGTLRYPAGDRSCRHRPGGRPRRIARAARPPRRPGILDRRSGHRGNRDLPPHRIRRLCHNPTHRPQWLAGGGTAAECPHSGYNALPLNDHPSRTVPRPWQICRSCSSRPKPR